MIEFELRGFGFLFLLFDIERYLCLCVVAVFRNRCWVQYLHHADLLLWILGCMPWELWENLLVDIWTAQGMETYLVDDI